MSELPDIQDAEKVVAAFGEWPSFHDAEILRIALDRDPARAGLAPSLQLQVRVRRSTPQGVGTADFHMALTHDFVIALSFTGITELELYGFNGQNVIDAISIHRAEGGDTLAVEIESIYGVAASWLCTAVAVSDIRAVHGAA